MSPVVRLAVEGMYLFICSKDNQLSKFSSFSGGGAALGSSNFSYKKSQTAFVPASNAMYSTVIASCPAIIPSHRIVGDKA